MIKALETYALENYNEGGHWVYETYDTADYQEFLDEANGDIEVAKANLKHYWELMTERERDCAWGGW